MCMFNSAPSGGGVIAEPARKPAQGGGQQGKPAKNPDKSGSENGASGGGGSSGAGGSAAPDSPMARKLADERFVSGRNTFERMAGGMTTILTSGAGVVNPAATMGKVLLGS